MDLYGTPEDEQASPENSGASFVRIAISRSLSSRTMVIDVRLKGMGLLSCDYHGMDFGYQ